MYKDNMLKIKKGNINLTSSTGVISLDGGAYNEFGLVCDDDGSITITWKEDNSTEAYAMSTGKAILLSSRDVKSFVITSGSFTRA